MDTAKLDRLERFVDDFDPAGRSAAELHAQLDAIAQRRGQYGPVKLGLASALGSPWLVAKPAAQRRSRSASTWIVLRR